MKPPVIMRFKSILDPRGPRGVTAGKFVSVLFELKIVRRFEYLRANKKKTRRKVLK